jgi:hypothetical protein
MKQNYPETSHSLNKWTRSLPSRQQVLLRKLEAGHVTDPLGMNNARSRGNWYIVGVDCRGSSGAPYEWIVCQRPLRAFGAVFLVLAHYVKF